MTTKKPHANFSTPRQRGGPFRRAVLHGLAILLPPLLTIVIFLWVGNTVNSYLLEPLERGARWVLVEKVADIRGADVVPADEIVRGVTTIDGEKYRLTPDNSNLVPASVYEYVRDHLGKDPMPATGKGIYTRYVNQRWLPREIVVPVFLCLFILVLYLLGKFLAAGVGRFFWSQLERLIHRVPLVRNVYASVKQITDFMFTEPETQYTRVVAVEYPRKGIWTVSFVTGESLSEIRAAAGEPIVSVLIPTSPMPFTGFTVNVRKSEVVELDVTVDQALQFIVSCGVVVPPNQLVAAVGGHSAQPLSLSAAHGDE
jgi:uncharacterized membrane protein